LDANEHIMNKAERKEYCAFLSASRSAQAKS
jgi:hypothetical protein